MTPPESTEPRTAAQIDEDLYFRIAQFIAEFASEDQQGYHWSEFISDAHGLVSVLAANGYTIAPTEPGRVEISVEDAKRLTTPPTNGFEADIVIESRERVRALIAAAERAATGGA